MATVTSGPVQYRTDSPGGGSWIGQPRNVANAGATANRERERAMQEAIGIGTQEATDRQAQTGVNPGTTGYVSGQVAPTGSAMAALGVTPAGQRTPTPTAPQQFDGQQYFSGGGQPAPAGPVKGHGLTGGTTTTTGALTAGASGAAPVPTPGSRMGGPATAGSTTTRTGALTGGQQPNTGTTTGQSPIPTGEDASPGVRVLNQVSPGLGDSLDPGSNLLRPTLTDTRPATATQAAAFGLSDDLSRERFDYRPGAAASQDVVQLDKANADQTRARQNNALDALEAAAAGTVPSAAELQLRQQSGKNIAATLGQARALGGRSAGGAARAGTLAAADILANANAEAGQLRAAEQERARQMNIQAALGVRGQDIDTAARDAGLRQDAYGNNLRAQLEQNELAERHRQNLLAGQLQALGIGGNAAGAILGAGSKNADADNKLKGGILGTVGSAFGL